MQQYTPSSPAFNANSSLSGYLDWSDFSVHFDEPASSASLPVIGREYTIRMRGRDLRVRLTGRNPRTPKGRGFWAVNVETGNFVTVGSPAMLRPIEEPELEPSDEEIDRARMLADFDDLTAGSVPPPTPRRGETRWFRGEDGRPFCSICEEPLGVDAECSCWYRQDGPARDGCWHCGSTAPGHTDRLCFGREAVR
jgi:hypothetical protein